MASPRSYLAAALLLVPLLSTCGAAAGHGPTVVDRPATTATSVVELTAPTTATVTAAASAPTTAPSRPELTDNRVYLLGDSITESVGPRYSGTVCDALGPLGWNVTVDAMMGRTTSQAAQSLRSHRSSVGQVVVVLIGHNDGIDPTSYRENLTRVLEQVPSARWILLLTNYEFERGRDRMNAVIYDVASSDDRIQVVDWNRVLEGTKGAIRGDGLHLTSAGEKALADTIAAALGAAPPVADSKTTKRSCITYRNPNPSTGQGGGPKSTSTTVTSTGTPSSGASPTSAPSSDTPSTTEAPPPPGSGSTAPQLPKPPPAP